MRRRLTSLLLGLATLAVLAAVAWWVLLPRIHVTRTGATCEAESPWEGARLAAKADEQRTAGAGHASRSGRDVPRRPPVSFTRRADSPPSSVARRGTAGDDPMATSRTANAIAESGERAGDVRDEDGVTTPPADVPPPPVLPDPPPAPVPETEAATPEPATTPMTAAPAATDGLDLSLRIPVVGIDRDDLLDTFTDARSGGRRHDAIDIMAPTGTPVVAVADGTIAKLFDSDAGGLTVYQFDASGGLAFYYAHLDAYAPGLAEGQAIRQGDAIGFVGHSGNAVASAPHLHFAIFVLGPERRWWQGTPVNPYGYLRGP